jgi:hypothetical protein
VLVGAAIAVSSWAGRAIAGLFGLAILLLFALVCALSISVPLRGGVGDHDAAPTGTPHALYRHAIGDFRLDLTNAELRDGETRVRATLGIGDLRITLPRDVDLVVHGYAHAGDIRILGEEESGFRARRTVEVDAPGATATLVVDAEVGLGDIRVERE